jgi:hypothetical protein
MTKKPFTCECGVRTYEPFFIANVWMCAICAEKQRPSIVEARARQWWRRVDDRPWMVKLMTASPEHD